MNIVVFTGSHRPGSNSSFLAECFIRGAQENGHDIYRFDSAFKNVHPCIGCGKCECKNPCIFKDDFQEARERIIGAQLVVFATPTYYFAMTTQIKACIDRFFSADMLIHGGKKGALLAVCGSSDLHTMDGLVKEYEKTLDYLKWHDAGRVLAPGFLEEKAIVNSAFADDAYRLGKNL